MDDDDDYHHHLLLPSHAVHRHDHSMIINSRVNDQNDAK